MKLSSKLIIIFELVLVLLVFALLMPVRYQMRLQIVGDIQNELRAIAATAALDLDGDLHQQLAAHSDATSPAFQTLRQTLDRVMTANHLTPDNIYTFYLGQDKTLHFGVMVHPTPFVGDVYDLRPHQAMALATGQTYTSELYHDDYGQWISAAAPILNPTGQTVGLLEVNRRAEAYFARYDYVILMVSILGLASLALSSLLGYLVLRYLILKPVDAIRLGMVALGQGDFTHKVEIRTQDELEVLANTLNRLFEQLNVARSIQANFLPKDLPDRPGYRFAARTDPCDATGGDYIDAFNLDDQTTAILVADVTGHGLGPSLIMASCRSALRALAKTGMEPADLLRRLEEQLQPDLTHGRFITMVFGLLTADGRFTYTNAGHAPAIAVLNGQVRQLDSHRPPLGIFVDMPGSAQSTLQLEPGDRIVLASDGLNESMNAQQQPFGEARIHRLIVNPHANAHQIVETLYATLHRHVDSAPMCDDVAVLCVDRTAPEEASDSVACHHA